MTRVVLLAPARLSRRPDLARLACASKLREVLGPISRVRAGDAIPEVPARVRDDRVIEEHEVLDPALVPAFVWRGRLDVTRAPAAPGVTVHSASARVTPHGVVTVALDLQLARAVDLGDAEEALCPWVSDNLSALCSEIGRLTSISGLAARHGASCRDLREDAFLWWHRLLIDPVPAEVLRAHQLDRYPVVELRPGARLCVGDGYSHLCCPDPDERARVVEGLAAATQVWIIADFLQRRLTEQAGRLRLATTLADRATQQTEATDLYEHATVEISVLLQTLRYTVGGPRQAFETAAAAWNIPKQLGPLVQSAESLRQAVERRHGEARDARAARLGRVVSALAFVSGFAVALNLFETAVGNKVPAHLQPTRVLVSGIVATVAAVAVLLVLRREG